MFGMARLKQHHIEHLMIYGQKDLDARFLQQLDLLTVIQLLDMLLLMILHGIIPQHTMDTAFLLLIMEDRMMMVHLLQMSAGLLLAQMFLMQLQQLQISIQLLRIGLILS